MTLQRANVRAVIVHMRVAEVEEAKQPSPEEFERFAGLLHYQRMDLSRPEDYAGLAQWVAQRGAGSPAIGGEGPPCAVTVRWQAVQSSSRTRAKGSLWQARQSSDSAECAASSGPASHTRSQAWAVRCAWISSALTAVMRGAAPAAALACRSAAECDNHHGTNAKVARAASNRIHDSRRRPRRGRRRASSSAAFGSEGELEAMGYQ
jgi:hypothetical protein